MELPEPVVNVIDAGLEWVYSFQPLAEASVVLVPSALRDQMDVLAEMTGLEPAAVSYALGMFACYPLGIIMSQIPYGMPRHLFSLILGTFLLQFTLGSGWVHQLLSSSVAYLMILVLPRRTLTTALPVFALFYVCGAHLHRQYIDYLGWSLDFTGTQMVITQKLYMIAFNLYDGELLAKGSDNRAAKKCAKFALKDIPGPLEFLGYMFCFSNVLAGPVWEYSTYAGAVDGTVFKTSDGKRKVPSNIVPTLSPLVQSLGCIALHLNLAAMFPLLDPNDSKNNAPVFFSTEFLAENPWPYRVLYCWCGLLGLRMKYYFGWKNAQGANNVWYAGFEGYDENDQPKGWRLSDNMDILGFELAPDVQTLTRSWNMKTSDWLTRYVYIRTGGNLFAVYSTSAFWHGFYPGYYIFFLSVPLITICDRLAKKKLSPYFSKSQWTPYGIAGTFASVISVNYMILAFVVLTASWSWEAYKSHYFFGHVLGFAYMLALMAMPNAKKAKTV